MPRGRNFVSAGLHNISKQIAEATSAKQQKVNTDDEAQDGVLSDNASVVVNNEAVEEGGGIEPVVDDNNLASNNVETCSNNDTLAMNEYVVSQSQPLMKHKRGEDLTGRRDKERQKAIKRRANEFVNAKKDIMGRLSKSLATIPDDIDACEQKIKLLRQYKATYDELLVRIEPLDDSEWSEESYGYELGKAMKMIENARLEYLSSSARLDKILNGSNAKVAQASSNSIDIASLTFKQLFRLGFILSLPMIIAVIFAAIIISISYFAIVS